ncbi:hypothetical protein ACWGGS_01715 [Streptomyces decoyicus]
MVTKGALLVFADQSPVPTQIIVFPLNPETLVRHYDLGQNAPAASAATEATAPAETFTLTLQLDATDDLEHPGSNPITVVSGLLPVISAIEQLLYPSQVMLKLTAGQTKLGVSTISAATKAYTVFALGPRVQPVKVSALTITEQAFDARLNPITAHAELQLTTLSLPDLTDAPMALRGLANVHAVGREVFARVNSARSAAHLTSVLPL